MRVSGILIVILAPVACTSSLRAQAASITELGRKADLVAFATVDNATQNRSTGSPDAVLAVQLRLNQVLKGSPASSTVLARLSEKCYAGGGGPGHPCVYDAAQLAGSTGIWFLQFTDDGYAILPLERVARVASDLCFQVPLPLGRISASPFDDVDETLLNYYVRWMQALPVAADTRDDDRFFAAFGSTDPRKVLKAIAPLIASQSPGEHAVGLLIALSADSADAMSQVVDELPTLRADPRLSEMVATIGHVPGGGPGSKDPRWIEPLRRLLALHADIPGMDAAAAGALYRIGTKETWPLIAGLLDSKDPYAQLIAMRTIAFRVPNALTDEQTRRFYPDGSATGPAIQQYAQFWKGWWARNRAALGFE